MSDNPPEALLHATYPGAAGYRALLDGLQRQAAAELPAVLAGFFKDIEELLFERADAARSMQEQRIFFDAMRLLRNQRADLIDKTLAAYFDSFAALLQNDWSLQLHQEVFDTDALQLVENDALEEMIALDNIVSATVAACGEELTYLTKRLLFVVGQVLEDEDNPLNPELFCEGFAAQIRALRLDREPLQLLYRHFQDRLVAFWPGLVATCNRSLREQGVLPDLETQKKQVVKQPPAAPSAPAPARQVTENAASPVDPRRITGELGRDQHEMLELYRSLRALFGEAPAPGRAEPPPAIPATDLVRALGPALSASRAEALATVRDQGLEAGLSWLMARSGLSLEQMSADHRGVVRVLDQAFRKLDERPFAPEELSALVHQLELPVAAMALGDEQFLAHAHHPGRRLINEIFKVSTTFLDGADAASDPLRAEVERLVARLQQLDLDVRALTGLLNDFIDFVEKDRKRLVIREQRLLEEEEALARVAITHGRVYQLFLPLLQGRAMPVFLRKFCEDAWSKVIFFDLLRSSDGGELWRDKLELLKHLLALVADSGLPGWQGLRSQVVEHLQGISLEAPAIARWLGIFDEFFTCRERVVPLPKNPVFDTVTPDDLHLNLPGIAYLGTSDDEVDMRALESVDALKQGIWVEFKATESSEALRCRLAGVVSPVAKFVFTNRRGKKVAEESRHRLAQQLKAGAVGVIDNGHLFDGAFEAAVNDIQAQAGGRKGAPRMH